MEKEWLVKTLAIGIIVLFICEGTVSSFNVSFCSYTRSLNPNNTIITSGDEPSIYDGNFLSRHLFFRPPILDDQLPFCNTVEEPTISRNIAYSIQETNDNGYIVCGYTCRFWCYGGFLVKTDNQGYEMWNRTYFIKQDTIFTSVEQVSDGGYIVTGLTYDSLNDCDAIFLLKTDELGNKIWDVLYIFDVYREMVCTAVKKTDDGGYILSIIIIDYDNYNFSVLLMKTDSNGTKTWSKKFDFNYEIPWIDVQQTTDGGYIVVGTIRDIYVGSSAFLLKTDENGNEIWNNSYSIMYSNYGNSVTQLGDGGFVITGYTSQSSSNPYTMIIKTDYNGVEEWNKTYEDSAGYKVKQTSDNGLIITGMAYLQDNVYALLLKTDLYGNKIWNNSYSGLERAGCMDVVETEDNGYVLTGTSWLLLDSKTYYALILKTDDVGDEQWYRCFDFSSVINPGFVKFYGWDVNNSVYKLSIKLGDYGYSRQSSSPIGYYEIEEIGELPGRYFYTIKWYGKEGNQSVNGYFNISAGEHIAILQNLTFCDDLPIIDIVRPKNMIYINNKSIIPFFFPVIVGNIELEVHASDYSSGVDYVEFYIDNKLMFITSKEPYCLEWNKLAFGKYVITVVAVDKVGYYRSDEIMVWKFF